MQERGGIEGNYLETEDASALDRLSLIEDMIREGRRSTEYWGWCFVLWGASYLVAMLWAGSYAHHSSARFAWPITMTAAAVISSLIARSRSRGKPSTTKSRAILNVWVAVGLGISVFAFPAEFSHRFGDGHLFMAGIEVLLGVAHLASGLFLRWRLQVAVGCLWWAAAMTTIFTQTDAGVIVPFLVATLLGMIGFGAYLMYIEARDKSRLRAGQVAHA